jgi:hypothetical protein
MQYIEAISPENAIFKSLFLAGGISSCPNWQEEVAKALSKIELTIFNPRRKNFDVLNPAETEAQIEWEYHRLRQADYIIFHFSAATLNPITLFEYGAALEREQKLFVNVHPDYQRKTDIEIQTRLKRPEIVLTYSIEDLVKQFKTYMNENQTNIK